MDIWVTAHYPHCFAGRVWPCVSHCTFEPTIPSSFSICGLREQQSSAVVQTDSHLCLCESEWDRDIARSVTQHDCAKWYPLTSVKQTFIEKCVNVFVTMGQCNSLLRQTDRKWIVIGEKREANRKLFPVNWLLLCSHVTTHTPTSSFPMSPCVVHTFVWCIHNNRNTISYSYVCLHVHTLKQCRAM